MLSNQVLSYLKTLTILIVYYFIGIAFYHYQEGWSMNDCAYFITVSICTVGYGILHPTSNSSRMFTVFYIIIGVIFILSAGSDFARNSLVRMQNKYLESLNITRQQKSIAKISISVFLIVMILLVGCLSYQSLEGYSGNVSFYFVIITILTIGYGDFAPTTSAGRTFSIFYILSCVIIFATAIHNIRDAITEVKQDRLRDLIIQSKFKSRVVEVQLANFSYASESSDRQTASLTSSESSSSSFMKQDSFMKQTWYSALCDAILSPSDVEKREFTSREHASLQSLSQMAESEFVLDMLVRLDLVDKRRHIDPLVQSFRDFKEKDRNSTDST